jgi:hypothetical protein
MHVVRRMTQSVCFCRLIDNRKTRKIYKAIALRSPGSYFPKRSLYISSLFLHSDDCAARKNHCIRFSISSDDHAQDDPIRNKEIVSMRIFFSRAMNTLTSFEDSNIFIFL